MRCKNPESIWYAQVAVVVEELYKCYMRIYRRMSPRNGSGFFSSRNKRPGYEAKSSVASYPSRFRLEKKRPGNHC